MLCSASRDVVVVFLASRSAPSLQKTERSFVHKCVVFCLSTMVWKERDVLNCFVEVPSQAKEWRRRR